MKTRRLISGLWPLLLALALVCAGCGTLAMPRVKLSGGVQASAPKDTGKPAAVESTTTTTEIPLPEQTTIELPAASVSTGLTQSPVHDGELAPIRLTLTRPTVARVVQEHQAAQTGTIDTEIAKRRVDNAARQPLLFAAIGAAAGAAVFLFLRYPTPALLCGIASGVFFIAWQAAGLPQWVWIAGAVAVAIGAGLYFGHERAEKSAAAAAKALKGVVTKS